MVTRSQLVILGAVLLQATSPTLRAAEVAAPPAEPVTETVFGRTLTDEYRWMEDPARYEGLKQWVLAESAATQQSLANDPKRAAFAASLKSVGGALTRVQSVAVANDRKLAFLRIDATDRVAKLLVRDGKQERVILDPNVSGSGTVVAINSYSISPNGRLLAVHTAQGGAEVGGISVMDIATGKRIGEPIAPVWGQFRLSWIDDRTVSYTQMVQPAPGADPLQGMKAYVMRLGSQQAPRLVLGPDTQPIAVAAKDFPMVFGSPISPWVIGIAAGARADTEVMVVRRPALGKEQTPWRKIAGLDQRVRGFALRGEKLLLLAARDNPHGRVTRRDLSKSAVRPDETLMDGNEQLILEGVEATQDGVYVQAITDGRGRLFFSPGGSTPFREVALPFEGSIIGLEASRDGRTLSFGLTGWLTNTRYFQARQGKLEPMGLDSDTWPGAAAFEVKRLVAASKDGTQVPLVVVHPRTPVPAGGFPGLVEGYGAYGISTATPYYDRFAMAWVEQGGAMAYCGTRGGGERGRAWHDAGRGIQKANAHDDLIACAEKLKAEGLARAVGPVAWGTSAGGLLAPPAALKRPDLFAGLVARVAVANATRLAAAANGANQFDEMGDPNTADGWAALASQDAYLMVGTASDIPDTLLTIGLNDKRVAPWMSTKLAARAKQRFGSKRAILLRADANAGHGVGSAEDARQAERADIFTFAWSRASR